jgi:hypothetical protein
MDKLDLEIIDRFSQAYKSYKQTDRDLSIKELLDDTVFKYCMILYLRNSLDLEYLIKMKDRNSVLKELTEFSKLSLSQLSTARIAIFDSFCYLQKAFIIKS